jgi:hypothetical protein
MPTGRRTNIGVLAAFNFIFYSTRRISKLLQLSDLLLVCSFHNSTKKFVRSIMIVKEVIRSILLQRFVESLAQN